MLKKKLMALVVSFIQKHPKLISLAENIAYSVSPDAVIVLKPPYINYPQIIKKLTNAAQDFSPETVVLLEYPVKSRPRWDYEMPHQGLYNIINENRELYKSHLHDFLAMASFFATIPGRRSVDDKSSGPCWENDWMPALDGIALYSFIVTNKPKIYLEVGSGNSTMFARKAISDHNLDTKIVSIDPFPREEINDICDEVIRKPVEEVDIRIFDRLAENDILYIDNSHRVFMNSDATVMFLDVLPRLKSGVLVEIHDIMLPHDYPSEWIKRYYSEQYLLAAYLLARGDMFDIIMPNLFVSGDDELQCVLAPLWASEEMKNAQKFGCSFWIKMK